MEITLNTENAYEIIRTISDEYQDKLNIGAGTVQTYDELKKSGRCRSEIRSFAKTNDSRHACIL